MSFSGPMMIEISEAKRRVSRSNSAWDISLGLHATPPLAPPNGRSTTAHFSHPHGKCADLFQVDPWVVANSPLGRTTGKTVLNPIAFVHLQAPSSILTGKWVVSSR